MRRRFASLVIATLRRTQAPALPAYSREGLLRAGQIEPARIAAYALLDIDQEGILRRIVEKPNSQEYAALPNAPVSLNSWLFDATIFDACERVPRSARGEYELPAAVQYAIDNLGAPFRTFPVDESVLDLSSRTDIAAVADRLSNVKVEL